MGWFDSVVQAVAGPVTTIGNLGRNSPIGQVYRGATGRDLGKDLPYTNSTYAINAGLLGGGKSGGNNDVSVSGANTGARNKDLESGYAKGRELFYDDPDMQMLRKRREDLSQGYEAGELGAMREQARAGVESDRANSIRRLQSNAARAGVGGARSAAMQAAADKNLGANRAELERKMALDNSNLKRQGVSDLQNYIMGQKYGELGTGLGYAQLGVQDRSADAQARAANSKQGGLLSGLSGLPIIGSLFG